MKTLLNKQNSQNNNNSSKLFLQRQVREEQKLSQGLRLKSSVKDKLQVRHSVKTIASFFDTYGDIIAEQHYLYVIPEDDSCITTITTPYPEKPIYTLDSYNYSLYSRDEYKAALQANMSKDLFFDINFKRGQETRKKSSSSSSRKHEAVQDLDIDVFGEAENGPMQVASVATTLKRPSATAHLDLILNYTGPVGGAREPEPVVAENNERQLKRYKKQPSYLEQVRELEIRLQLEQELHDLQAQIQAKRIAQLEARVNGLQEDNVAKDRELTAAARREAAATAAATTPAPVRLNGAPRKKQTPKTSKKKQSTQRHDHHQQQPLELFMVQQQHPQQPLMLTATVDESIAVTAVNEERIRVREEQERAAIAQAELDGVMEAGLTTFYEAGVNVGTLFDTNIRLSAYLEKFLDATNAPNHNNALRNVIDHIFYAKYRVSIMANMRFFEPQNDQQRTELFMVQKGDVLNRDSPTVRYNISNVTIHAAFIAKAIEFADSPQSSHYTPIIMANFPHRYDPLLVQKWYPFMDSGNGHLVTTDLKIPAVASLQGQGHGKACHYCGLQYIASCNGVLKHTHQVNHCDYIANLSNDERLIITTVLAKCATDEDLAAHPFMANRNEKSLFRLATPFEEQHGRYVLNEATRERLRINMPVLLRMRQETYADFLIRINTLDTHLNREMNLNAKLLTFQFDCFGLNTPSAKKKNTNTNKVPSGKISKEDGFLYKSLLDHQGNQFRKTKFTADGKKTLRDFTTLDAFGFADDMFFSMPAALTPEELNQSADAFLMQNMALMNQLTYTIPQPEQEPFLLLNAAAATTTHEDDSLECHLLVNTEPDNAWQPFAHDPIDAYGYNNNNTSNNEDELAYSFSRQNSF